jgi:hypothetical protein
VHLIRWGWNLPARREKWARRMIRRGRASGLHMFLAERAAKRKLTGRRVPKLKALIGNGLLEERALALLNDVRLKVLRKRTQWWLVLTVASKVLKEHPATGLSCGIDPGEKTPSTVAGAGSTGSSFSQDDR